LDNFAELAYEDFVNKLMRHMKTTHPEKVWNMQEEELHQRIEKIIKQARGYGIETERDVAALADLSFELGDEFELEPERFWAREILTSQEISEHEKIVRLEKIAYGIEDDEYMDD